MNTKQTARIIKLSLTNLRKAIKVEDRNFNKAVRLQERLENKLGKLKAKQTLLRDRTMIKKQKAKMKYAEQIKRINNRFEKRLA